MASTTDAIAILRNRLGRTPELDKMLVEERTKSAAARAIYEARTSAGMTQAELARRIGTRQSVIARLESADYTGHTLTMLNRIATALSRQVDVRFVPAGKVR